VRAGKTEKSHCLAIPASASFSKAGSANDPQAQSRAVDQTPRRDPSRPDTARSSSEAVAIGIDNHSIRANVHFHDVFLDGHRIVKVALAIKELLESSHHQIDNFALSFQFRGKDTNSRGGIGGIVWQALPHGRNRSLEKRIDENAEATAVHCQDYLARFVCGIKRDFQLPSGTTELIVSIHG
jgi:hypothetical protein